MNEPESSAETARAGHCPWCSAAVPTGTIACPACGATLVPPAAIADLPIPGVTAVEPALQWYDAQPLRIPLASPSQSIAAEAIVGALPGGPVGLAALAGFGVVFAAVRLNRTVAFDVAIALRIQGRRRRTLGRVMTAISWPGFPPQSRIIPPAIIGGLWRRRLRLEAAFEAAAWGTALM